MLEEREGENRSTRRNASWSKERSNNKFNSHDDAGFGEWNPGHTGETEASGLITAPSLLLMISRAAQVAIQLEG